MRLLVLLLFLSSCSPIYTVSQNPNNLSLVNGVVSYQSVVRKNGVKFDEYYRAARSWIRQNQQRYSLKWEKPVYKATLLQSAIIPTTRIGTSSDAFFAHRTVSYLITVIANNDSCRVMLSNFEVFGVAGYGTELERLAADSALCVSVNAESRQVLESLSRHIHKESERSDASAALIKKQPTTCESRGCGFVHGAFGVGNILPFALEGRDGPKGKRATNYFTGEKQASTAFIFVVSIPEIWEISPAASRIARIITALLSTLIPNSFFLL
jgi:hypothetical protein